MLASVQSYLPRLITRRFIMAGSGLAFAAIAGIFMTGGSEETPMTAPAAPTEARTMLKAEAQPKAPEQPITEIQMTSSEGAMEETQETLAAACPIELAAASGRVAMIDVSLTAPCFVNEAATVHHEGMMFNVVTDENGQARFVVPALKAKSVVLVSFANGAGTMVETDVPTLDMYDRVVLQWQGVEGLQMHAFEKGATYNDPGHIWNGAPGELSSAAIGDSGFLLKLGNPAGPNPLLAEVYTFPSGFSGQDKDVVLTVEAEITAENCQTQVIAQTLQFTPSQGLKIQDMAMKLPECDAIGEFLVLDNLLQPVRLAQN